MQCKLHRQHQLLGACNLMPSPNATCTQELGVSDHPAYKLVCMLDHRWGL